MKPALAMRWMSTNHAGGAAAWPPSFREVPPHPSTQLRLMIRRNVHLFTLLLLTTAHAANASPSNNLAAAVMQAPAVTAARLRMESAESRESSAGPFADPQLGGSYNRKQTPDEENPVWDVSLEQPLPKAGERAADRLRASAATGMAHAELYRVAGDVAAETAMQLAEAETARHHLELTADLLARMEQVLTTLDTRIATGQGRIAERLTLQTRIASTRLMAARDEQSAFDAESDARAQLGLAETAPLPDFSAPRTNDIAPDQTPAVHLAEAREDEASAMAAMARASRWPMTSVGLQFERDAMDAGNEDMLGLAFMTELPWHSRHVARADLAAARSEQDASRADGDAARQELTTLLARVARAEFLANTARHLASETESRLDAEYDSLLRNAGTASMGDELPLLMLLDVLEKQTEIRKQVVEAEGAARVARAALWRHAPERQFTTDGASP